MPAYDNKQDFSITERICKDCQILKPITEFTKSKRNKGGWQCRCKSCASARWFKRYSSPEYRTRYLLERIKSKCKKNNIAFDLTKEDIIIPSRCPILNIEIKFGSGKGAPADHSPSVDRIIPEKGYTKGNVVIISQRANRIKNDATIEEIGKIYNFYTLLLENEK